MKVLADAAFTAVVAQPNPVGMQVSRWNGGPVSDKDLIAHAADHGFDVVAFLGTEILVSVELGTLAEAPTLAVAVVIEDEPIKASWRLLNSLTALKAICRPGQTYLVRSDGVEALVIDGS